MLTLFPEQVGVKAEVVDAEVQPALPRHLALPVAAGVIVDQLLLLRHDEELAKLSDGLLELIRVVILSDIMAFVVFGYNALNTNTHV